MLKYLLLLGTALCFTCQVYAGGDAKNMTDHELRVKASWNCESAKGWCAEDQSVTYNKCKCAKRMCDAAQRAGEAAERGYDNGAECKDGGSYCGTAKSSECEQALAEGEPKGSGAGGEGSATEKCTPCDKIPGKEACVLKPNCECDCSQVNGGSGEGGESSGGEDKNLSCDEIKKRMIVHKSRCDAGNQQACKDYKDRKAQAEKCDKDREKERNTGNAKGDDCSTVIKKAQVHKKNCEKGNKQACKDYEDRRKEAEKCGTKMDPVDSSSSSSSSSENCRCQAHPQSGSRYNCACDNSRCVEGPCRCKSTDQWRDKGKCKACPKNATCNGKTYQCKYGYTQKNGQCVKE